MQYAYNNSTMLSINCELSVAYIVFKLAAYSIRDSIHKILMGCSEFHMTCDMMLLCLQAEVNASDKVTD